MNHNDPTGALTGEIGFHPGDADEGPLPQRVPGATFGAEGIAEAAVERAARKVEGEGR